MKICLLLSLIPLLFWAASAAAEFTENNLIVVNDPSAMSAGVDSLDEFSPDGGLVCTLVPQSLNIKGMRRVIYDPYSDHVFYSISSWSDQVFEIREIDSRGNLMATYSHADFNSGNISMAVGAGGDLFIANGSCIFVKEAGTSTVTPLFDLPYTGIGDLEMDSRGNLYLSDPFISDVVYLISPEGNVTVAADSSDGVTNPYGIAVDQQDDLYVACNSGSGTYILKKSQGTASVFSQVSMPYGILDMTVDGQNRLFVANRENDTILVFDSQGNAELFADAKDGLRVPSSLCFILPQFGCIQNYDGDADADGKDLAEYALKYNPACLDKFAGRYGNPAT